jgi:hypothetical protein
VRKVLGAGLCAITATAPAVAFAATNDEDNEIQVSAVPQAAETLTRKHDAKAKLNMAVERAERAHRKAIKRKRERELSTAPATGGGTATPAHLEAIAACESGGDPSAVGGGGAFRGKYQFDYATWASVGGTGDPAAASEAEQDQRAAMLYARSGSSPWPVCGS